MAKQKISVQEIEVTINKKGYLSLTDIAKRGKATKPISTIRRWLRNQKTLSFLFAWEEAHNPDFKVTQIGHFRDLIENNALEITPKMYIENTGAIGITSTAGKYGGTYAHTDIALDFCRWLDPVFSVWLNKEFQRRSLKAKGENLPTKTNYLHKSPVSYV